MKSFLAIILSVAAASLLVPMPAAADCYKEVQTVVQGGVNCGANDSVSADFSNVCSFSQSQTVTQKIPVDCQTQWVNSSRAFLSNSGGGGYWAAGGNQTITCAKAGMVPGNIDGQVCASFILRPQSGVGYDQIDYSLDQARYDSRVRYKDPIRLEGGQVWYPGSLSTGVWCDSFTHPAAYGTYPVAAYACTQSGKVN